MGETARGRAGSWRLMEKRLGGVIREPWLLLAFPQVIRGAGSHCSTRHPPCFPSLPSSEEWEAAMAL